MGGTIFGIGPMEIVVIAVLVLLVFGPNRLPDLMRQAGHGVRKLRSFIESFSGEFQKEVAPFAGEFEEVTRDLRKDLSTIRDAVDLRQYLDPATLMGDATRSDGDGAVAVAVATVAEASDVNGQAATSADANSIAPNPASPPAPMLADDNPWAGGEASAENLDEDNPWRA